MEQKSSSETTGALEEVGYKVSVRQIHIDRGERNCLYDPIALALWDTGATRIRVTDKTISFFTGELFRSYHTPPHVKKWMLDYDLRRRKVEPFEFAL